MPHADAVPKPLLNLLLMIVAQSREGMTLAEIKGSLSPTPPDRVLLKALGGLVDAGRLAREGVEADARYRVVRPAAPGNRAANPAAVVGGTGGDAKVDIAAASAAPVTSTASTTPAGTPGETSTAMKEVRAVDAPSVPDEERDAAAAVAEIFDATITTIVGARMSASTSTMLFQRAVAERISAPERRTCLVLLKAKLDQFSAKEAARYEIEAETYREWREVHEHGIPGAATRPDATGAASEPDDTAPSTNTAAEPSPAVSDPGVPSSAPTPPRRHRTRPAAPTTPTEIQGGTSSNSQGGTSSRTGGATSAYPDGTAKEADALALVGQLLRRVLQPGQSDVVLRRVLLSGIGVAVSLIVVRLLDNPGWGYLILPLAAVPGLLVGGRGSDLQPSRREEPTNASLSRNPPHPIPADVTTLSAPPVDSRPLPPRSTSTTRTAPSTASAASSLLLSLFSGRRRLQAACVLVLLAIGILVISFRAAPHPSLSEIEDHLTSSLAPLPVRVAELHPTFATPSPLDCLVRFNAVLETTAPLYKSTPEALTSLGGPDLASAEAAAALLYGPLGVRIRAALTIPEPTPTLASVVVVTPSTPAGTRLPYAAAFVAQRAGRGWTLGPIDRPLDRSRLVGTAQPPGSFASDDPADVDALKRLLAQHAAYATHVRRVADLLSADLARERQQRADQLASLLQPGTFFTGAAVHPSRTESHKLILEITDYSPTSGRIRAVLRNDGGWSDARLFQGDALLDHDAERVTVTLRTRGEQRLPESGPLLDQHGELTLTLDLRVDGTLAATASGWNLQLVRISPGDVAPLKADLMSGLTAALAATHPGALYRGVAIPRQGVGAEPLLLRFTEQDPTGSILVAELESTAADGQRRTFRGMIVDNTYRAGSTPIRLRSTDADRVLQASPRSLLGYRSHDDSLALSLRPDGNRLVGETDLFTFRFEPADPASVATAAVRPTASTTPPSPASPFPDLPTFPTTAGAYVLSSGAWQTLPAANVERTQQRAKQQVNTFLGALQGVKDLAAGRVPDLKPAADALILATTDEAPAVSAGPVVVVYIGILDLPPSARQANGTAAYPLIEMAATQLGRDGRRLAPLVQILPGVLGFGAARLSAIVEQPRPGVTLLRSTVAVSPGLYAIACGSRTYELKVK